MRFTPSEKFLVYARAIAKRIAWRVYVKKTTDITEDLETGAWIDVSHRVSIEDFPNFASNLEYELGQFVTDSISLTLFDIPWWKANVFDATPAQCIECKVQFQLESCSDIVYTFSGWIDKLNRSATESLDQVTISAFTAQDLGSRLGGEILTTQYIEQDIVADGLTIAQGLQLKNINGIFLTDAALAGYILKRGEHKLSYTFQVINQSAGDELIVNGGFATPQTAWHSDTWQVISGHGAANQDGDISQVTNIVPGHSYTVTFEVLAQNGAGAITPILGGTAGTARSTVGTFTETIIAGPGRELIFRAAGITVGMTIDNVSVQEEARVFNQYAIQLDDGCPVFIDGAGYYTLGNGSIPSKDTDRIEIYSRGFDELEQTDETRVANIITTAQGDTLPRQWFVNSGMKHFLKLIHDAIGITDLFIDDVEIDVAPSPAPGVPKVSFLDNPPNNDSLLAGTKWAICSNGVDGLFIAVGHQVYLRLNTTGEYELLFAIAPGHRIYKLIYNARNNHLWIFYGYPDFPSTGTGAIRRFDLTASTLSAEVTVAPTASHLGIELIDFRYSDAEDDYVYGILHIAAYIVHRGSLLFVDGLTLTQGILFLGDDLGLTGGDSLRPLLFIKDGSEVFIKASTSLCKVHVDDAGAWQADGTVLTGLDPYVKSVYHPTEQRIYYSYSNKIYSHPINDPTITTNLDNLPWGTASIPRPCSVGAMYYAAEKVWLTLYAPAEAIKQKFLFSFSDNEQHDFADGIELSNSVFCDFSSLAYHLDRLYGIDNAGRLFQYHSKVAFSLAGELNFSGNTVQNVLNQTLAGFHLISNVNSFKKGYVYQRGDGTGAPRTSGSTLQLTIAETAEILEQNLDTYAAFDVVEITNGRMACSFDGTDYNVAHLSNTRKLSINNDLIPNEIMQDLCYHVWQFFKTGRVLYILSLGLVPLFQFEPFDGCSIDFTNTKIQKTAGGIIYGTTPMSDGSMEVKVLI